jgi:transposase-like protein
MEERDWSLFACPNPACSAYAQPGRDNLRPHGWSSKAKGIRCLRCTRCGKHFSERAGTPFFRTQLPEGQALRIAEHLVEGTGVRATGRLCGVSLNTVLRFALRAGEHAEAFHNQMVQHVRLRHAQADEAWAFVGKKTSTVTPVSPRIGSGAAGGTTS